MDMGRLWANSAGFELGLRGFERVLIDLDDLGGSG